MTHDLNTWTEYFRAIEIGDKTFEIRRNDRFFQVNDTLVLHEYDPVLNRRTGRIIAARVAYILNGGRFGIKTGYVAMSIEPAAVLLTERK